MEADTSTSNTCTSTISSATTGTECHMYDLAIIGRGMIGAAAARHAAKILRQDDHDTTSSTTNEKARIVLIGPSEPDANSTSTSACRDRDVFGAHYDEGRITRRTDPDPIWAELASRSIARYKEIFQESGLSIDEEFFVECGHLAVGMPMEGMIQQRQDTAASMGIDGACTLLDSAALRDTFPCLSFPDGCVGLHETKDSGYISARGLVRAQTAAAQHLGVDIIDAIVSRVNVVQDLESTTDDDRHFDIHFEVPVAGQHQSARKVMAKKVLVAAGAFTNARPLLPKKLALTPIKTQTVHFVMSQNDADKLIEGMPSVIVKTQEMWAYILPPIRYPDSTIRLKLGGAYLPEENDRTMHHDKEVVDWYQSNGDKQAARDMEKMLRSFVPNLTIDVQVADNQIINNTCATLNTLTRQAYIGHTEDGWAVATGGNGYAAKSSDELGRLAATCILKKKEFEKETICGKLCTLVFRPRYGPICTLHYKYGKRDTFPLRVDSIDDGDEEDIDNVQLLIESTLEEELLEEIQQWENFWKGKKDEFYYSPSQEDEIAFLDKGEELRHRLEEQLTCYDNVTVRLQARPIRKVKLMNEYCVVWPLWPSDCHKSCNQYISSNLKARVKAWANHFNENFHYEYGWKMEDQGNDHFAEGKTLERLLNQELDADPSTDWCVYMDFWERSFLKGW